MALFRMVLGEKHDPSMLSQRLRRGMSTRQSLMFFLLSLDQDSRIAGFGTTHRGAPPASSLSFPLDLVKLGSSLRYAVLSLPRNRSAKPGSQTGRRRENSFLESQWAICFAVVPPGWSLAPAQDSCRLHMREFVPLVLLLSLSQPLASGGKIGTAPLANLAPGVRRNWYNSNTRAACLLRPRVYAAWLRFPFPDLRSPISQAHVPGQQMILRARERSIGARVTAA